MFTREFFIEAIIYVLEKNKNEIIDINSLFNKLLKVIIYPPDDDILKFQLINYLNYLKNEKILMINDGKIIMKNCDENISFFKISDDVKVNDFISTRSLKKILIDLKNYNSSYYKKLDTGKIFEKLIEII
tara:strand:- start:3596 stop:3985 length:390 start_codon:yes stop_codon:yes gene_type:complete